MNNYLYATVSSPVIRKVHQLILKKDVVKTDIKCHSLMKGPASDGIIPLVAGLERKDSDPINAATLALRINNVLRGTSSRRTPIFIVGKITVMPFNDYDILVAQADPRFGETSAIERFQLSIRRELPDFNFGIDEFCCTPSLLLECVRKGSGQDYADNLNESLVWNSITMSDFMLSLRDHEIPIRFHPDGTIHGPWWRMDKVEWGDEDEDEDLDDY